MDAAAGDADYPRTQFFQACRGVFEGGGCRGAAHVGAYEAALRCGVNFSEVASTSAGSIVAALVAAGASPEYLLKTVAYLKFESLLSKPKGRIATPWQVRCLGLLLRGSKRQLGIIAQKGSAHSSERIQQWVDDRLAELLPQAARPVMFKDLRLPAWIVATDLSGRRAKIWSTRHTPDASVSFAVRCSCSIPVFFEPVEAGLDLYVDGGMLSNLPAFVFAEERMNALTLGGRILGFRLEGDEEHSTGWSIGWLIKRLIDTAIGGATTIQGGILRNVSTVRIPTGQVSSTNFNISSEEVTFLLDSGRSAVRKFILAEHSLLDDDLSGDVARYGKDELYDDLAREMATCGKRLLVACQDTRWVWDLFPSVAFWAFGNAAIEVIITRDADDGRERQRRAMMERLGVRFHKVRSLPFTGYILNRADDRHDAAFITRISDTEFSPTGAVYVGPKHRPVIQGMTLLLEQAISEGAAPTTSLRLQMANPGRLIELLKKGVNQYVDQRVSIALEEVDLQVSRPAVRLIVQRIRSFKYRQMASLAAIYQRFDLPLGAPADVYAGNVHVSTVTPPVLERWGDDLVAIEGNTRIFYLDREGAKTMPALVVSGVAAALPATPVAVRKALLATYQMSQKERMKDHRYDNFRSIEGAVRPEE
jgi:predicted acylesterase/phospholipase RssA